MWWHGEEVYMMAWEGGVCGGMGRCMQWHGEEMCGGMGRWCIGMGGDAHVVVL